VVKRQTEFPLLCIHLPRSYVRGEPATGPEMPKERPHA
jgi:hypothetical protein